MNRPLKVLVGHLPVMLVRHRSGVTKEGSRNITGMLDALKRVAGDEFTLDKKKVPGTEKEWLAQVFSRCEIGR